ncbi:phage virion morphogenesis protein [Candidatus Hepatincola sp. Av]
MCNNFILDKRGIPLDANQKLELPAISCVKSIELVSNKIYGDELIIGTDLIYGGTHQYGNFNKNIPKREYLGLSTANEAEIEKELTEYLEEILYE